MTLREGKGAYADVVAQFAAKNRTHINMLIVSLVRYVIGVARACQPHAFLIGVAGVERGGGRRESTQKPPFPVPPYLRLVDLVRGASH